MSDKPKWKKGGKDWGDAVLLKMHIDPKEMADRPNTEGGHAAGQWSARTRTVEIADQRKLYPDMAEEAREERWLPRFKDKERGKRVIRDITDDTMKEYGSAVISHELAHWQLGHSQDQASKEARVKEAAIDSFGTSDWDRIGKEWGEGYVWGLENYEDLVSEFEVHLLQEVKGWYLGPVDIPENLDTFMHYFKEELGGRSSHARYEATTIKRKRQVFNAANDAIANLFKKGILTKKQASHFRRKIWVYTKQKYST